MQVTDYKHTRLFGWAKCNGHGVAKLGNCSCLKQAEEMDEILVIKSRGKTFIFKGRNLSHRMHHAVAG